MTFSFVVLGTFITRSGLVESVHAFEGDTVSFWFFIGLIVSSLVIGVLGLVWRRKTFVSEDEISSFTGREAAYYFNNVFMVVSALLLTYLTLASALPSWLPYGGQSVDAGTYETVARIIGIVYFLMMSICPLLSWRKTDGAAFWKKALVPGICAAAFFALLMLLFATSLLPSYNAIIAGGGTAADDLAAQGPAWYYNGIAVLGFLVASLLLFNSIFAFARDVKAQGEASGGKGFINYFRYRATRAGGMIVHMGMAVMLVGLIGSMMYVTEQVAYLDAGGSTQVDSFTVTLDKGLHGYDGENLVYGTQVTLYNANGVALGTTIPNYELTMNNQQKSNAAVFNMPLTDVFVAYQGNNTSGQYSLDIRVNPLISFVWAGLVMLIIGSVLSLLLRNRGRKRAAADGEEKPTPALDDSGQTVAELESHVEELEAKLRALENASDDSAKAADGAKADGAKAADGVKSRK